MKSDKNTETYLSKYIKTQNPYNQGKSKKKTLKKPIIYKILNQIKHKKQRFNRKKTKSTSLYKPEQHTPKNKNSVRKKTKR